MARPSHSQPEVSDGTDDALVITPPLRFPEFRNLPAWRLRPLDTLAHRPSSRNIGGTITRVLTNSAEHGVLDQRDYFDREIATPGKIDDYYVVDQGDYVYNPRTSTIAPVGPVSRNNLGKGAMSPLYTVFRFNTPQTDFFEHYFRSTAWHPYLRRASSTGARHDRMAITPTVFMRMPVPEPEPAEQQKIADCLMSLDEVIAAQGRKVDALKAHKKGLMQHLFPQEGQTLPRLRFPEFRDGPEWQKRRISDLLEKNAKPATLDDDTLYREIGVRSHGKGLFHKEPTTGKAIGEKRVFHVVPNALVINIVFAWEQALAVTTEAEAGFIASHRFPMFVPKENQCDVAFIQRLFLMPAGKQLLKVASPGGAGRNRTLSQTEFEQLEVVVPDTPEQTCIADCLASLDATIAAEASALAALKAHKKGLMQGLFPSRGYD